MITSEEFKERLDELCRVNGLANALISKCGFTGLPKHLQADCLKRMGLRSEVCPHSFAISYHDVGGQQTEITGEQFRGITT